MDPGLLATIAGGGTSLLVVLANRGMAVLEARRKARHEAETTEEEHAWSQKTLESGHEWDLVKEFYQSQEKRMKLMRTDVDNLQLRVSELLEKLAVSRAENAALGVEVAQLRSTEKELRTQITQLTDQKTGRDIEISSLRRRIADLERERPSGERPSPLKTTIPPSRWDHGDEPVE